MLLFQFSGKIETSYFGKKHFFDTAVKPTYCNFANSVNHKHGRPFAENGS